MRLAVTIWPQSAGTGTGRIIAEVIQRQREARMNRNDWVNRPSTRDRVQYPRHIFPEALVAPEGNFVRCVGRQDVRSIEVARRPVGLRIVQVLVIRVSWRRLG